MCFPLMISMSFDQPQVEICSENIEKNTESSAPRKKNKGHPSPLGFQKQFKGNYAENFAYEKY